MRHGWFRIPGLQDGDRTPEEQLLGLEPALAACLGKRVLDLGSAEGLISQAFARAGAVDVLGVELLQDHVNVARKVCKMQPQVRFVCSELAAYIAERAEPEQFDIVLALSVAHKLHRPGDLLSFAARSAKELVVFRGPGKVGMFWDGWLKAKFGHVRCHVPTLMREHGFTEGDTLDSAHRERVQYWHRKDPA